MASQLQMTMLKSDLILFLSGMVGNMPEGVHNELMQATPVVLTMAKTANNRGRLRMKIIQYMQQGFHDKFQELMANTGLPLPAYVEELTNLVGTDCVTITDGSRRMCETDYLHRLAAALQIVAADPADLPPLRDRGCRHLLDTLIREVDRSRISGFFLFKREASFMTYNVITGPIL
ncbi:hypothetical protein BJY01DRAFT_128763 [Aspergillus pseudoustus]|uniref:Uncharacterized protein n=1 Tax=Aspergillus pseudoustus TaxID=1810923 RepID=A0ABR4IPS3_9EURO